MDPAPASPLLLPATGPRPRDSGVAGLYARKPPMCLAAVFCRSKLTAARGDDSQVPDGAGRGGREPCESSPPQQNTSRMQCRGRLAAGWLGCAGLWHLAARAWDIAPHTWDPWRVRRGEARFVRPGWSPFVCLTAVFLWTSQVGVVRTCKTCGAVESDGAVSFCNTCGTVF